MYSSGSFSNGGNGGIGILLALPRSEYGSHIVTSAGIAVPVLQIAPGTQVPLGSAAGLAAGLAGRPKARRPAPGKRSMASIDPGCQPECVNDRLQGPHAGLALLGPSPSSPRRRSHGRVDLRCARFVRGPQCSFCVCACSILMEAPGCCKSKRVTQCGFTVRMQPINPSCGSRTESIWSPTFAAHGA